MRWDLEDVTKFVPLRLQILLVVRVGSDLDGNFFDDLKLVAVEPDHFSGIVSKESDLAHSQIVKDLGTHTIVPQIGAEAEAFVGFHCIEAFLLELVGPDLVCETNAPAFLAHVYEDTLTGFFDLG